MATIQKRGDTYKVVVRRTGYPSQTKTFETKASAEAWARAVEASMDAGKFQDRRTCKLTSFELMTRYETEVVPTKRGWRAEQMRLGKLRRIIPWVNKPINDVNRMDVVMWRDARLRSVSSATVRREMIQLSGMFSYAQKEWLLPIENPMRGVSKPADSKARSRRPSLAELGALRTLFKNNVMGALMDMAIETAMRLSELTTMTWEQVDVDSRCVHLLMTKNGEPRDVPLSSRALEVLEEQKVRWTVWRFTKVGQRNPEAVFCMTADVAGRNWREACEQLGIKDLHFHDLRHEATTRMAKKLNHLQLAKVTGHKDMKQLQRYYNPEARELADLLG